MVEKDICDHILAVAARKRDNAGYSGSWGDGGASSLEAEVEVYRAGRAGTIPTRWREYEIEFKNQSDPDFETYQRLKQKFEK
jgi:hypothetical protein